MTRGPLGAGQPRYHQDMLRPWTMRLVGWTACAWLGCAPIEPSAELLDATRDLRAGLPVFPFAEGFGTTTPAGRGGQILRVTHLEADGPGSLRAALSTPGARMVVFEVAGQIAIREPLVIAEPYVTVAGQTAPSPGITIYGASIVVATHDVLLQHLRVRAGDALEGPDPGGRDSLTLDGGEGGRNDVHDVVIDHGSFSWAIDEGVSTWNPGVRDITVRASIISENLSHSLHPKGEHSKGLLIGDHSKRVSVIGCLFAHNRLRNPILKGDVSAILANNVLYNPGAEAIHLDDPDGSGPTLATVIGNVLVPGPDTNVFVPLVDALLDVQSTSVIALSDNFTGARLLTRSLRTPGIFRHPSTEQYPQAQVRVLPLSIVPADQALDAVLRTVGARPADRDGVDARVVAQVRERGGAIIDSPSQVGGLPRALPVTRTLHPPDQPESDDNGDGYTRAEEWLHQLARAVEDPS